MTLGMSSTISKPDQIDICFLAFGDKGGGVIWVADSLCRRAQADGFSVKLLTMLPLSAATIARIGYPVECLNETPPYTDTPENFVRWVEKNQPDVLFLNDCHTMDHTIPYLPQSVRCVYVVHDTMKFYRKAAIKYEASLDAIVAVSGVVGRRIRPKLKHPEKLHVIQNGTVFPPMSEVIENLSERDLIFVGGDNPRKGAPDVLQIWPRLLNKGFNGYLHWFGPVADEFKSQLKKQPKSKRIIIYGHVSRVDVLKQFSRSAALLMLSRAESFGMVLIEAMGMGCVPVAWDCSGTATTEIVDRKHLLVARLGDYDELVNKVLKAIEIRDQLATELAKHVRKKFSSERMWGKYRDLIVHLDERPLAPRPRAGECPKKYSPPIRASYLIPKSLWRKLRPKIGKSAKLYHFIRSRM